ncbi:MAG TPA: BrnT family toxin [Terracidiphilus sp.]|nr:BrnT family toxin [Terracidiphilus sp.]
MESEWFEWDDEKAAANLRKHGVGFPEATTVVDAPDAIAEPDEVHAEDEPRWIATGFSQLRRVLLVVFTVRGQRTRIVSAREASPAERRDYESQFES